MSNLTILRTYAKSLPESIPLSILFKHSSKNITIFDGFPKSIFHFLILPRIREGGWTVERLANLQVLLNGDKETAKDVVTSLSQEAELVKKDIQEEMIQRYGFKWDIWIGFHGAPSMQHLHLHVISADLCSEKMKSKKHYNSFHPKLGFFLHINDILSWFESEPFHYANMVKQLKSSRYEPLLKEQLVCFHCEEGLKNVPALKIHLEKEWDKLQVRGKAHAKRKMPPSHDEDKEINKVKTGSP